MTRRGRSRVAGLGLVELLVSLVLGLFIVVVAIGLLLSQLREQQHRALDTRLQQEMRAALVLVEHDVRRSGHWGDAAAGLWQGPGQPQPASNPYAAVLPDSASSPTLAYAYSRDDAENQQVDANEHFGLRLNAGTGALEWRVGGPALAPGSGDNWQAITDPQTVRFTAVSTTAQTETWSLADRCTTPCPLGSSDCPPRLVVRRLQVALAARSTALPALQARDQRVIHLPTDVVQGRCPD